MSEDDLVILMLEDFILPAWENINVLQSGDLVTVTLKSINKHQELVTGGKKVSSNIQSGTANLKSKASKKTGSS